MLHLQAILQSRRGDGLFAGADASLQSREQREVAKGYKPWKPLGFHPKIAGIYGYSAAVSPPIW